MAATRSLEAAIAEYQQTVYLDPSHQYAANELAKTLSEWQKLQKQDLSEMEKLKRKAKAEPGRVVDEQARGLEIGGGPRHLMLHGLELRNRLPELLALFDVQQIVRIALDLFEHPFNLVMRAPVSAFP